MGLLGLLSELLGSPPAPPDPVVGALREGRDCFDGAMRAAAIGAAVSIRLGQRAREARLESESWRVRSKLAAATDDLKRAAGALANFYERRAAVLGQMAAEGKATAEGRSDELRDMASEHRERLVRARRLGYDVTGLAVSLDARAAMRDALRYVDALGIRAEVDEEVNAALRALPESPREWDERLVGRSFERLELGE